MAIIPDCVQISRRMPDVPEWGDWDLNARASRFALRPGLGLLVRESEWPADGASDEKWAEL
jgi:hypothetical protein